MRSGPRIVLLAATLALGAAVLGPDRAVAHTVPTGVGSRAQIELSPGGIHIAFDMAFSQFVSYDEFLKMDRNEDAYIDDAEIEIYLRELGDVLLPNVRCTLDGQTVPLEITKREGLGLKGEVMERIAFDTVYDFVAKIPVGAGRHELQWYEGNFKDQESIQEIWLASEETMLENFREYEFRQKEPIAPPQWRQEGVYLIGRDVTLRFEFEPSFIDRFATGEVEIGATGPSADRGGVLTSDAAAAEEVEEAGELIKALHAYRKGEMGTSELLIFLLFALFLGAAHAFGPGHGKTMVATYLVGTKGTVRDALYLGVVTTFTHTFTIFILGFVLLYIAERVGVQKQAFAKQATFWLSLVSGVMIILIGLSLLARRVRGDGGGHGHDHGDGHGHDHGHDHGHGHGHDHDHDHDHDHGHGHGHGHDHAHLPTDAVNPETFARARRTMRRAGALMIGVGLIGIAVEAVWKGSDPNASLLGQPVLWAAVVMNVLGAVILWRGLQGAPSPAPAAAGESPSGADERPATWDLITLGFSGGMVPCPAGMIVVLVAFQLGVMKFGLVVLTAFSAGLGAVIVGIAVTMVFSRSMLDRALGGNATESRVIRALPVVSAVLVIVIGHLLVIDSFTEGRLLTEIPSRLYSLVAGGPAEG